MLTSWAWAPRCSQRLDRSVRHADSRLSIVGPRTVVGSSLTQLAVEGLVMPLLFVAPILEWWVETHCITRP